MASSTKTTPRDALVMAAILKDMGIIEYEPRVINQMLEFTYKYITNIFEDARVFSSHAKKKTIDVEDVRLAIQMQMDKSYTTPPPRDILIDISRQRNNMPLPLIKPHCGLRLPPDRYCLSACNYHMKTIKKSRQHNPFSSITTPKINLNTVNTKIMPAINLASKSGASLSLVNKGITPPTVTIVTRPTTATTTTPTITTTVITASSNIPTPVFKLSTGSSVSAAPLTTVTQGNVTSSSISSSSSISTGQNQNVTSKIPSVITRTISSSDSTVASVETPGKRKREDDDYDAE